MEQLKKDYTVSELRNMYERCVLSANRRRCKPIYVSSTKRTSQPFKRPPRKLYARRIPVNPFYIHYYLNGAINIAKKFERHMGYMPLCGAEVSQPLTVPCMEAHDLKSWVAHMLYLQLVNDVFKELFMNEPK